MRDALSLLDQAVAYSAGQVTESAVRSMLGVIDQSYLFDLADALVDGDAQRALGIADAMEARSLSLDSALAELGSLLHRVALAQVAPDALDPQLPERERIVGLAGRMDPETVQLFYQIAVHGRRDLALAPDEYAGFTMALMRMLAFTPGVESERAPAAPRATGRAPAPAKPAVAPPPAAPAEQGGGKPRGELRDWPTLVRGLNLTGAARQLAERSELVAFADNRIELCLPPDAKALGEKVYVDKLKAALAAHFGAPVGLAVKIGATRGNTVAAIQEGERKTRQDQATASIHSDAFVRELVDQFDGTVVDASIKPAS
jgi:DNA polymerase-3 subunit gamma/tau